MSNLEKWDLDSLMKGNWEKWLSVYRYRRKETGSQKAVIGAWGRKANIIWMGKWKGSNAY